MKVATVEKIVDLIRKSDWSVNPNELDFSVELNKQNVDSLDMMTLLLELEEAFSVKIDEDELQQNSWATINDIVDSVNLLLKKTRK